MVYVSGKLENAGLDCWPKCNHKQGACEWCGSMGFCCTKKKDWYDTSNGCDGTFGGKTKHECVLKPGKSFYNRYENLLRIPVQICLRHVNEQYDLHILLLRYDHHSGFPKRQ